VDFKVEFIASASAAASSSAAAAAAAAAASAAATAAAFSASSLATYFSFNNYADLIYLSGVEYIICTWGNILFQCVITLSMK
jgi:roadblock/LC7 domain-containing protein